MKNDMIVCSMVKTRHLRRPAIIRGRSGAGGVGKHCAGFRTSDVKKRDALRARAGFATGENPQPGAGQIHSRAARSLAYRGIDGCVDGRPCPGPSEGRLGQRSSRYRPSADPGVHLPDLVSLVPVREGRRGGSARPTPRRPQRLGTIRRHPLMGPTSLDDSRFAPASTLYSTTTPMRTCWPGAARVPSGSWPPIALRPARPRTSSSGITPSQAGWCTQGVGWQ